jgi:hypothetical protein
MMCLLSVDIFTIYYFEIQMDGACDRRRDRSITALTTHMECQMRCLALAILLVLDLLATGCGSGFRSIDSLPAVNARSLSVTYRIDITKVPGNDMTHDDVANAGGYFWTLWQSGDNLIIGNLCDNKSCHLPSKKQGRICTGCICEATAVFDEWEFTLILNRDNLTARSEARKLGSATPPATTPILLLTNWGEDKWERYLVIGVFPPTLRH